MGRAVADRLACCKALMVRCTHCEDGGKALLSQEELKVLRSHWRQAEAEDCTHFLQDYHAVDQNCCNTYLQDVQSCCSCCHEVVHSFVGVVYNCFEAGHKYLEEDHSCPEADHSSFGEDHKYH